MLHHGERVALFAGESSDDDAIPVNYPEFVRDVEVGNLILLADGTVQLVAVEKRGDRIVCEVHVGGVVGAQGVNLPLSRLSVKAFKYRTARTSCWAWREGGLRCALFVRAPGPERCGNYVRIEYPSMLIARSKNPRRSKISTGTSGVDGVRGKRDLA